MNRLFDRCKNRVNGQQSRSNRTRQESPDPGFSQTHVSKNFRGHKKAYTRSSHSSEQPRA